MSPELSLADQIAKAAEELVEALVFDDSGANGRGGNGGLISRHTIHKSDLLRVLLLRWRKLNQEKIEVTP